MKAAAGAIYGDLIAAKMWERSGGACVPVGFGGWCD
jgi:hypothetical protein